MENLGYPEHDETITQIFQGQEPSSRFHYYHRADGNLEESALKTHITLDSTISFLPRHGVPRPGISEEKGTSVVPLQICQGVIPPHESLEKYIHTEKKT